ncbi:SDR family NAD(P)-dependent oxidoreductase [Streptomyces sp. BP-8]|uniref:SDR family NAD(P)-dependent oxidoreductase n=1 Tax=Streptomyces sirii TaxID=3127701 RepID=A0ABZ2R4F4_9ACTN
MVPAAPSIAGLTAAVTGGSRGLGLLLARQLLPRGCDVVLLARDASELSRAVAKLDVPGAGSVRGVCAMCGMPPRSVIALPRSPRATAAWTSSSPTPASSRSGPRMPSARRGCPVNQIPAFYSEERAFARRFFVRRFARCQQGPFWRSSFPSWWWLRYLPSESRFS